MRALIVGGLAGLGVAGYFMWQKKGQIERRGGAIQEGLTQLGAQYAQDVAKQTAEQYLGEVYGLTPERIENIGVLAARLRRPGSS